jgi:thioester reductase-like protein
MTYFVTGATGFIGRFLIGNLLKRKGTIHVLVRKGIAEEVRCADRKAWAGIRRGSCRCRAT